MKSYEAVVAVESIAAGGNGVGRVGGMACFIPRTAPGDSVRARLRVRKRFAEGKLVAIEHASTHRVEPRCHHYASDRCGGCQLQHMSEESQRESRALIVRDALSRIGKRSVNVPVVHGGSSAWGYRRRMTLTLNRRGAGYVGGFHPYDDPVGVFQLTECLIAHPQLSAAWSAVKDSLHLLPKAQTLRLSLHLRDDLSVVAVIAGGTEWSEPQRFGTVAISGCEVFHSVWWQPRAELGELQQTLRIGARGAGSGAGNDPAAGSASDDVLLDVGRAADATLDDILSFTQVNSEVAALLRNHVADTLFARNARNVIDAYAGAGLLSEQLARQGVRVRSIELDARGTAAARERMKAGFTGTGWVEVHTGSTEELLPAILTAETDSIVVNPPRRGLAPEVTVLLEAGAAALATIVYVSCDPATLARDIAALPSWEIAGVECFDMFPQTAHVETVCVLVRQEKSR